MAATRPDLDDTVPSITNVSSTSARLLYYELEDRGEATVEALAETTTHDEDRVRSLLDALASEGLVVRDGDAYGV
ncbi:MAG: TrmB family transcriptional regulator [Halanaeroarchaeum sp.]